MRQSGPLHIRSRSRLGWQQLMRRPWPPILIGVAVGTGVIVLAFAAGLRRVFIIGATSDGHRLLEARCQACHTPWRGPRNEACISCHRAELKHDHHPAAKFDNVARWGDLFDRLDPRDCRTCHREHRVAPLGFTGPADLCRTCHADITDERASHRGFGFADCLVCHNYHDEQPIALAAAVRHLDDRDTFAPLQEALDNAAVARSADRRLVRPADAPPERLAAAPAIPEAWRSSVHAPAQVNCSTCHGGTAAQPSWIERPDERACARCHTDEVSTYYAGRHGMRAAATGTPLAVRDRDVRLPMRSDAPDTMSCSACHGVHGLDLARATVSACLGCHDDTHTRNYRSSPHGRAVAAGRRDVPTCATCHLPAPRDGQARRRTNHDNSLTARPPERMLGEVCLGCHGLRFAWSALRSAASIRTNFASPPPRDKWVDQYLAMVAAQAARRTHTQRTPP